ncbi:hypothetical protein [Methanofollis fontis]|uniref:Uncharacterized protein n=1 Tax=Methanofollis fontis TaxID=2052832 RepID=A0A483CNI4_9EURY|nr:hypothetical protein [Methanofollis fontis]TAJ43562.1 hypothetical protein CUJ86_10560 [Methanofollis fontis]
MTAPDRETIFAAAVRILLDVDRVVTVHYRDGTVSVQFPTTRRLAEHLGVPHYYVLPYCAEMERDGLIRRVERVGISTTPAGTRLLLGLMSSSHLTEAEAVIGGATFRELLKASGLKDVDR